MTVSAVLMVPLATETSAMSKSDEGSLKVNVKIRPTSVVVEPLLTTLPAVLSVPSVAVIITVGPTPSDPVMDSLDHISLAPLWSMIVFPPLLL